MPAGGLLALVLVVALAGFGPAHTDSTRGMAQVSPTPSLGFDIRLLLKEFQVAQQSQLKALLAKEKAAAKDLQKLQASKQKDFDLREKEARRKFFADQHPGTEKRTYMHELLARRDAFKKELADERAKAKDASDRRIRALKDEQADHFNKFKDSMARGERPADRLWPQPGT